MNGIFSPIEVDILYFLSDKPKSSGRDILVSVETVNSRASMTNMITRLMGVGAIERHREVLFSLATLGMCLVGKIEPGKKMLEKIRSLGLTSTPLTRKENSYWREPKSSPVTFPKEKKSGAALSAPGRTMLLVKANSKRHIDKAVVVKQPNSKSFNVKTNRKPGDFLMQEVNIKHFHFSDAELSILETVKVIKNASTAEFDGEAVRSLISRRYLSEQDGVINATFIGRAMLSSPSILQGLSTLNLTRDEIVLFELSLQNNLALIKIPGALQRLKCTGSVLDKVTLKLLLDSWCDKGWAIQRSNHMYYFTFAARVVAGVTAVTKRSGPPVLSMVGEENLSFVTGQVIFSGIEEDKKNVKIKKQKTAISVKKERSSPNSSPEKSVSVLTDETTPLESTLKKELAPTLSDEAALEVGAELENSIEATCENGLNTLSTEEKGPLIESVSAPTENIPVSANEDSTSSSITSADPSQENESTTSPAVKLDDAKENIAVVVSEHASHASLDFLDQAIKDIEKTKSRMNSNQLPPLIDLGKKVVFLQHVRDVFFPESSVTANRMLTMIIDDLSELKAFSGSD
jgi:hypothetical protein